MSDTLAPTPAAAAEETPTPADTAPTKAEPSEKPAEKSFSQADVDRIVAERLARERAKAPDVEKLQAEAARAKTADERIADLEAKLAAADHARLVANVAAAHGIASQEDIDLFLTGQDEETLVAQASRLSAALSAAAPKRANVVPHEGDTPTVITDERRNFLRSLTQ